MKRNNEWKFMSVAIRNGSVYVLALGAVVGLATVRAVSDDSLPTALGSAQHNGVASTPNGEQFSVPIANIGIDRLALPLNSCCVPLNGERAFTCFSPTTTAQCAGMSGVPVRSCSACIKVLPSVHSGGEVDTMGDDSLVTEPAGASPVEPAAGSAWTLIVATLFLASL